MKVESVTNKLAPLGEGLALLRTPKPPYYAVISANIHSGKAQEEYDEIMKEMLEIAQSLPGFLGSEFAYETLPDGRRFKLGVTYWDSLETIDAWRQHPKHLQVKKRGKALWYDEHNARICHVLSHYGSNLTQKKTDELACPVKEEK